MQMSKIQTKWNLRTVAITDKVMNEEAFLEMVWINSSTFLRSLSEDKFQLGPLLV